MNCEGNYHVMSLIYSNGTEGCQCGFYKGGQTDNERKQHEQ
jgi:hypothetical protein